MAIRSIRFDSAVGDGIDVSVRANYTPAFAGSWYRKNGDPGDPPEPAEVEILEITALDGSKIDWDSLSDADKAKLDEQAGIEGETWEPEHEPEYED